MKVVEQVAEPLQIHRRLPRYRAISKAEDMLGLLKLGGKALAVMYPFQLSGGMNQRVIFYAGEYLEAVAFALLLLALIVLAARWVNRRYH